VKSVSNVKWTRGEGGNVCPVLGWCWQILDVSQTSRWLLKMYHVCQHRLTRPLTLVCVCVCVCVYIYHIYPCPPILTPDTHIFDWLHQLTPCNRVLTEKVTSPQPLKQFVVFYGTRRFISAFTTVRRLSLLWANQSMPPPPPHFHFCKIHFNIFLPFTPGSCMWSPFHRFPHWNLACNVIVLCILIRPTTLNCKIIHWQYFYYVLVWNNLCLKNIGAFTPFVPPKLPVW
jgi:hypothetical protein